MCLPRPPATFERWKAIETTGRALGLTAGSNKKLELQVMDLLSQTVQRAVQWMHEARIAIATLGPHTDVAGKKRLTPRGRIEKMRRLVASSRFLPLQLDAHLFSGLEEQMDAVRGELREENAKRKSSQEGSGPPKKKKKKVEKKGTKKVNKKVTKKVTKKDVETKTPDRARTGAKRKISPISFADSPIPVPGEAIPSKKPRHSEQTKVESRPADDTKDKSDDNDDGDDDDDDDDDPGTEEESDSEDGSEDDSEVEEDDDEDD